MPTAREMFGPILQAKIERPSTQLDPAAARAVLSLLPGSGDVIAAQESQAAGQRMAEMFRQRNYSGAAVAFAESLLHGLGALPFVPALVTVPKRLLDEGFTIGPVFHSTKGNFEKFDPSRSTDIGVHFGTIEQAHGATFGPTRAEAWARYVSPQGQIPEWAQGANIRPAMLKIEKPLRVDDLFNLLKDSKVKVAKRLHLHTPGLVFDQEELSRLYDAAKKYDNLVKRNGGKFSALLSPDPAVREKLDTLNREFWAVVETAARRRGYDGFVYRNKVEGSGDSYVVFDANQVRSVFEAMN